MNKSRAENSVYRPEGWRVQDGSKITDKKLIANSFNELFFSSIGNHLASSIPDTNTSYKDYLKASLFNSFYIFPTSAKKIENEISQLSSSKSSGPFRIPTSVLRLLKTTLSKPLELIYNLSFSTSELPE